MTALPADTRVLTKYKCPDCHLGKIPREDSDKRLFDYSYCPSCEGTGYIQYWATTTELARAISIIQTILSSSK